MLWVPTIMLNADGEQAVDATLLTDVTTTAVSGCESIDIAHHAYEHWIVLEFGGDLKVGPYNIKIAGTLPSGRPFALALSKAVEIVNWDKESNWDRFIVGDHLELRDHPFITGDFITDADYERLKAELVAAREEAETAKAEAEAAKEEWERKAEELEDVAKETTSQEIKDRLGNYILSTDVEYAAFKSHMATEIANVLTPIEEEENE